MHPNMIRKRNRFHVDGDTGYLTVIRRDGSEVVVTFDAADLEVIEQHAPWHIASWEGAGEERLEYAAASIAGRSTPMTLHRFLMETKSDEYCRIIDKNPLNCRRSNLENIVRRSQQGHARRRSGIKWIYYDNAHQHWQVYRRNSVTGKMANFASTDSLEKAKKLRKKFEREEKAERAKSSN